MQIANATNLQLKKLEQQNKQYRTYALLGDNFALASKDLMRDGKGKLKELQGTATNLIQKFDSESRKFVEEPGVTRDDTPVTAPLQARAYVLRPTVTVNSLMLAVRSYGARNVAFHQVSDLINNGDRDAYSRRCEEQLAMLDKTPESYMDDMDLFRSIVISTRDRRIWYEEIDGQGWWVRFLYPEPQGKEPAALCLPIRRQT